MRKDGVRFAGRAGRFRLLELAASGGTFGDEHELSTWAVGCLPHVEDSVTVGGQARFDLVLTAEPEGGVRGDDHAVRQEAVGVSEGDEWKVDVGDLTALLH